MEAEGTMGNAAGGGAGRGGGGDKGKFESALIQSGVSPITEAKRSNLYRFFKFFKNGKGSEIDHKDG